MSCSIYCHVQYAHMHAKLLQSCPALCKPMDYSSTSSCPQDSLGKNTGEGFHSLLSGIFSTQGLNPCLLHWQVDSLPLSHQGSPTITLGAEGIRMNKTRNTAKEVARGGEGVWGAGGNKCLMDLVFVFCGEIHLHKINRNYF